MDFFTAKPPNSVLLNTYGTRAFAASPASRPVLHEVFAYAFEYFLCRLPLKLIQKLADIQSIDNGVTITLNDDEVGRRKNHCVTCKKLN